MHLLHYVTRTGIYVRNLVSFERSLRRIKLICPSNSHYPLYILHSFYISRKHHHKHDNDV